VLPSSASSQKPSPPRELLEARMAPPPVSCPAPEATFVDSWGFARSGGRRHKGVDMMAAHGSPVIAPVGGAIRASNSSLGGLGFWLEADDGNTYFGSHLASLLVRGGRVEAGTLIGTVGSTGNAGTPHLHFEVMLPGKVSVNPFPLVAQWCPAGVQ
jgi:peptidoglycan LD-endopeptidase LytH